MKKIIDMYRRDIEADGFKMKDVVRYGLPMTVGLIVACILAELLNI